MPPVDHPNRLFIKHLNFDTTREDLEEVFGPVGPLTDVRVMSGFGFVEYENKEDADTAIQEFDGLRLKDFEIGVSFYKEQTENDRSKQEAYRVRLFNLPDGLGWQELKDVAREVADASAAYSNVFPEDGTG